MYGIVSRRKQKDRMKIVYSDKHAGHDPQTFVVRGVKQRSAEQPERATRLLAAARSAGHQVQSSCSESGTGSQPSGTVARPTSMLRPFGNTISASTERASGSSRHSS